LRLITYKLIPWPGQCKTGLKNALYRAIALNGWQLKITKELIQTAQLPVLPVNYPLMKKL